VTEATGLSVAVVPRGDIGGDMNPSSCAIGISAYCPAGFATTDPSGDVSTRSGVALTASTSAPLAPLRYVSTAAPPSSILADIIVVSAVPASPPMIMSELDVGVVALSRRTPINRPMMNSRPKPPMTPITAHTQVGTPVPYPCAPLTTAAATPPLVVVDDASVVAGVPAVTAVVPEDTPPTTDCAVVVVVVPCVVGDGGGGACCVGDVPVLAGVFVEVVPVIVVLVVVVPAAASSVATLVSPWYTHAVYDDLSATNIKSNVTAPVPAAGGVHVVENGDLSLLSVCVNDVPEQPALWNALGTSNVPAEAFKSTPLNVD